ncbi:MAG: transporter ATP-binding protein [Solirubrobacterales bacterium]|jgi:branched-chain amino acid transport system permease protein|nr:transporter ATP-binding protein [Solirubrobacterales bacterium]
MSTLARRTLLGTAIFAVPLTAIAFVANAMASPADMRVVVNFMISLVLVLAIQSFSGNTGIISFGHLAFMGVGAYVAAIVTIDPVLKQDDLAGLPSFMAEHSVGFIPAVLLGGLVGGLVAGVLGVVLTRMREGAMAMATIGVLVIFFVVFDNWEGITRGNTGIAGIPQSTTVFAALVFALLAIAACRAFCESRFGLQLRGSRSDPVAAEALGSNVVRLRWVAWTLSGAIMGVGGALWAQYNIAVGPQQFFFEQTFPLLAMLVVGGLATVSGGVVGVFVITIVFEVVRRMEDDIGIPGLTQIVVAVLILVVLNRRPNGIMGGLEVDQVLARLRGRRRVEQEGGSQ